MKNYFIHFATCLLAVIALTSCNDKATLRMLKNGETTWMEYQGKPSFADETLTIGNHRIAMSIMDSKSFINTATVYRDNVLVCTVAGLLKSATLE